MRTNGLFRVGPVAAIVACAWVAPALAQLVKPGYEPPKSAAEAVASLDRLVGTFAESDRAENVLLPALAAMTPPPAAASTPSAAELLSPKLTTGGGWDKAASWAQAEPQQKALAALKEVTPPAGRWVFALPYGAPPADLVKTGLTAELGSPPLIARANLRYLGALDRLGELVNVEATRLAEAGKPRDGADLLIHWLRLARIMADRHLEPEKLWALRTMRATLERIRDLVYTYESGFRDSDMADLIQDLDTQGLAIDRITLPLGDRIAALQLIGMTMIPRGGPNPETFGPTLARMASADRPLRLFGEAGRWQRLSAGHKDWFETIDALRALYDDWLFRWDLDPRDPVLRLPSPYARMDTVGTPLLAAAVPDLTRLFGERLYLRTELIGTQMSLGVVGQKLRQRGLPATLFLIRGRFAKSVPNDPFDPSNEHPLQYFVPVRDQPQDARRGSQPHVMTVTPSATDGSAPLAASASAGVDAAQLGESIDKMPIELLRGPGGPFARLKAWAAMGLTESNLADRISQSADVTPFLGATEGLPPDTTPDEKRSIVTKALQSLFGRPAFKAAYAKVTTGVDPTDAELRQVAKEMLEVAMQAVGEAKAAAAPAGGAAAPAVEGSFTVSLDESNFVLYSVGPDGKPEWAKSVGGAGSDILFWPPLLSLERQEMARKE